MNKPKKQYKGCLKIPLDTSKTLTELLLLSVATGDWRHKKRQILDSKRHYTLNLYLYNIIGELEIITLRCQNKITSYELRSIIDKALNEYVKPNETLNYGQSYITVSA